MVGNRSIQVKVSKEYAKYLKDVQTAINLDLGLNLSIPDVTKILIKTKDTPRVVIAIKKRPGRGGRTIEEKYFK